MTDDGLLALMLAKHLLVQRNTEHFYTLYVSKAAALLVSDPSAEERHQHSFTRHVAQQEAKPCVVPEKSSSE